MAQSSKAKDIKLFSPAIICEFSATENKPLYNS